mgnify:CR=1 FL=1
MKHVSRLFSVILLAGAGLFYMGCDDDDGGKSQEQTQLDKLKATWTLQSANDGTDRTDAHRFRNMYRLIHWVNAPFQLYP